MRDVPRIRNLERRCRCEVTLPTSFLISVGEGGRGSSPAPPNLFSHPLPPSIAPPYPLRFPSTVAEKFNPPSHNGRCFHLVQQIVWGATSKEVEELTGFDEGPVPSNAIEELEKRGITVTTGVLHEESRKVMASYRTSNGVVYNARNFNGKT